MSRSTYKDMEMLQEYVELGLVQKVHVAACVCVHTHTTSSEHAYAQGCQTSTKDSTLNELEHMCFFNNR